VSDEVLLSVIGGVVTILTALIGKVAWDGHRTRQHTEAVHESVNNRPTSLSDRLDEVHGAVSAVAHVLEEYRRRFQVMRDEQSALREDVRGLSEADRDVRAAARDLEKRFAEHLEEARGAREQTRQAFGLAAQALETVKQISKES
jgi:septation ring formation regulator EzrA